MFHVKRRTGWLSCGGMVFENCFPPIVAEELVFHVKPENSRKFFLTVGGMRFDFSIGHNAKLIQELGKPVYTNKRKIRI